MSKTRLDYSPKFLPGERLRRVMAYNQRLASTGRRNLYTADTTQLVYHWTDKSNGIVPQTGEWSYPVETNLSLGDHACRVDIGAPFPKYDEVPSHVDGYEETPENFARDYAFLLEHSPCLLYTSDAADE